MTRSIFHWKWMVLGATLALGMFAAINWQGIILGSAVASSESRPKLLSDAKWGDPKSAHQFNKRFGTGADERDLISWLQANHFEIEKAHRRAERRISRLPCNELVSIAWEPNSIGTLKVASATVTEAGCL